MHIPIAILILLWPRTPPTASAAPASANSTTELAPLQIHQHPHRPNAAEVIDYHIPGTTTTIHFILGAPLPPAAMSATILAAHGHIAATIAAKGDSVLPASEDPFTFDGGYGAFIRARSAEGRLLTWSLLEGAVVALYNGLVLRGRFRANEFWIREGGGALVGIGEMGAGIGWGMGMAAGVGRGKGNGG